MVNILAVQDDTYHSLMEEWAPDLQATLRIRSYKSLPWFTAPSRGNYVFSDLERLSPVGWVKLRRFHRALLQRAGKSMVLNRPDGYRGRFELLRLLHAGGLNDFNVYRLGEIPDRAASIRYPVFLRRDCDHAGPRSELLNSPAELERAVSRLRIKFRWFNRHRMMVTEFCDCASDDGLTRKYSVLRIGKQFIPRHVFFDRSWMIKYAKVVTEELVAEEQAYLDGCEHLDQVREAFDLAGIDYGRVDYGVRNGRIQIWEINTNPTVMTHRAKVAPMRMPLQIQCAGRIAAAFRALDQVRK